MTIYKLIETIKSFDSVGKNKPETIMVIRELLYHCSYSKLEDFYKDDNDNIDDEGIAYVRKAIINFFYSGQFTLTNEGKLNEKAQLFLKNNFIDDNLRERFTELDAIHKKIYNEESQNKKNELITKLYSICIKDDFKKFIEKVINTWKDIHEKYLKYLNTLIEIDHIIVYEAPPCTLEGEISYFLITDQGRYSTALKSCFNEESTKSIINVLKDHKVGYFDLIMFPLPLKKENKFKENHIRKYWSSETEWTIGGKPLPVVLFELGLINFIINKKIFSKKINFAFGSPENTSCSIFEYYANNRLIIYKKKGSYDFRDIIFNTPIDVQEYELIIDYDISTENNRLTYVNMNMPGVLFPLFKASVIDSSGWPNSDLMKNAFDFKNNP